MKTVHMVHATTGDALCGAHRPRFTTSNAGSVRCPLCGAMLDGKAVVMGVVEGLQQRVTEKLVEMQRDPGVRALTGFARSVLEAAHAKRAKLDQ